MIESIPGAPAEAGETLSHPAPSSAQCNTVSPLPAERPENQPVIPGRMPESAHHGSGDTRKPDLSRLGQGPRGVDHQCTGGSPLVANPIEAGPVARPDHEPQPVPGEIDRFSDLAGLADREHLQAPGAEVVLEQISSIRRKSVLKGGAEPLHEVPDRNGRRSRIMDGYSAEPREDGQKGRPDGEAPCEPCARPQRLRAHDEPVDDGGIRSDAAGPGRLPFEQRTAEYPHKLRGRKGRGGRAPA